MNDGSIHIRGARENNLQNVDVDLPRNQLIAITGVSGSGKSSLAFDTLFREGQRRFLETLSAYARQFLGHMEKPDVDHVEGLSPAIAVDQKTVQRGPRSTVGTITEIVDHLRVLFARAGTARCPAHDAPLATQTSEAIVTQVLEFFGEDKLHILAPLVRDRKGQHRALFADLAKKGFVRVRVDGAMVRIEDVPELERYKRHTVEVVVDRCKGGEENIERLRESMLQALEVGGGDVIVCGTEGEHSFSTLRTCSECGLEAPPLEPRLFSFNSPHGACDECDGLGLRKRPSARSVIADPAATLRNGALAVTRATGGGLLFPRVTFDFLGRVAAANGFDLDTPWNELSKKSRQVILRGTGEQRYTDTATWDGAKFQGSVRYERRFRGVLGSLERAVERGTHKRLVARFLDVSSCPSCNGSRLNRFACAVSLGGATITDLISLPVGELSDRLAGLSLSPREAKIAEGLVREVDRRARFLVDVGLDYLSLERAADTLSGGESQRIRLAAQLGAGLQGVLYVLDEPSIGLHPRDHGRLFRSLQRLRDAGNTVVVVEHDESTLRQADWVIDIGPGPGVHGGHVVAQGTPSQVRNADSPTGKLLRGELELPAPRERRKGNGNFIEVEGARGFNLTGVTARFPLGAFTCVSGVSGSGKSTLVHHTLHRALARSLGREAPAPEPYDAIRGLAHVEELVFIDSGPIGRTPRSNPATYSGAFTPIRDLFANLPESKLRGWPPGRFSFNVAGGRCEACQGAGARFVELQFLAPVTVECEECGGHRFQEETLRVKYRGHSIAEVLQMTIEEACVLFKDHPKIARPLETLVLVGLGYLTLGQPSTTLSGGEAQRVKLAKHLQKRSRKHTVYLLDEPTTGLHHQDVQRLLGALQALCDQGHTVVVIEHMLGVVTAADHVIELGPEGGTGGGQLVFEGTPEELFEHKTSHTAASLREERELGNRSPEIVELPAAPPPPTELSVVGARTHNLKNISVSLPRNSLTVVTGPSGSGKSSLALDTIHAAGKQRFVESLSTYARQFLATRDRPPVERIDGLGPSVAVEARTSKGHPRSTVATTTEIHDHLRVLWARAGRMRCPTHGETLEGSDASRLARRIAKDYDGRAAWLVAPVFGPGAEEPDELPVAFADRAEEWRKAGYVRALVDGLEVRLDGKPRVKKTSRRIDLVIDRLNISEEARPRLAEGIESAEMVAGGRFSLVLKGIDKPKDTERIEMGTLGVCTQCGFRFEGGLEPRHFSFNTHVGACPGCDGLGERWQSNADLLISDPEFALVSDGSGAPTAIEGKLGRYLTKGKGFYEFLLRQVAKEHKISIDRPFQSLSTKEQDLLLHGRGAKSQYSVELHKSGRSYEMDESFTAPWPGLCGHVDAWHAKSEDAEWRSILEKTMRREVCSACEGERLAPGPRHVSVGRKRLPELLRASVEDTLRWLQELKLPKARREGVEPVLEELTGRVRLLGEVGLGYLTLDRRMATLSGGEARRVRLSASLGSALVGVCYVLDEPTVGLHPADVESLTDALLALRDGGNTVIVVEHDESLMWRADHIIDMGPGAGRFGGEVVASGTPAEVAAHPDSLTGKALRGELLLEATGSAGAKDGRTFGLVGARLHNLRGVDFEARFGVLTGVCGPSGSGKSSLILDCLVPALTGERAAGRWSRLTGTTPGAHRVVVVDAAPLGRTPASIPATAVGLMDPLRELFARTPEARMRGFSPASFSFNSTKGRCPACEGRGSTKVEMQFLADLWLECEECDGRRYRPEVQAVHYRGRSIADVLIMSVEEASEFLVDVPAISRVLQTLIDVGLGYLALGQSSTTLSAGEAQRVKLAAELLRARGSARGVVVLDEPTTGLHKSDIQHLYRVLRRLAARGDAVIVIEHHTDLLATCDQLVELGPCGGEEGGRLVATGTPAELARNPDSITGPWLPLGKKASRKKTAKARASKAKKKATSKSKASKRAKKVTS